MFRLLLCVLATLVGLPNRFSAAAHPLADKPAVAPSAAEKPAADEKSEVDALQYLRISKTDAGKPQGLDTAIIRFAGREGTPLEGHTVDLVGVVHIGQAEYYEQLKRRLAQYDVVLYELVAPDGTRIRQEDLEARRGMLA